ncbi:MAG: hypothetical protein IPN17_38710 [Deltaproteobacteria bacterium]|nr:hypothetical protein [Deltaproteobacteria bacterium]
MPDYKRRWLVTPKDLAGRVWTFDDEIRRHLQQWIADRIEAAVKQPSDEQIVTLHDV